MQGDFSRTTFDPVKHFAAVLSQQGRVTLDADVNEGAHAFLHYLRAVVADIVGPSGYPAGAAGGFEIALSSSDGGTPDLTVSPGRMYVDGILVENDEPGGSTYWTQPDAYLDPDLADDHLPEPPYLVYLRVWERLITSVQDPSIREIALGHHSPDTSARQKVVWQIAALPVDFGLSPPDTPDVGDALAWIGENLVRDDALEVPRLRARAIRPDDSDDDLCDVTPDARYRGPENQLYRVEVHTGGTAWPQNPRSTGKEKRTPSEAVDFATFKFSRENASIAIPIDSIAENVVTLAQPARDRKLGLDVGDWVEIVDDASDSRIAHFDPNADQSRAPALRRVTAIDRAELQVTLADPAYDSESALGPTGSNPELHPLLRRWDHLDATRTEENPKLAVAADGALPIVEDTWIGLEDGIQIQLQPADDNQRLYRRGDYWLVPARTIPGDVIWPQGPTGPESRTPDGIEYHHAPLAWVHGDNVVPLRVEIPTPNAPS